MEVLPEDTGPYRPQSTVQDVRVHPDGRVSAVVDLDGEIAYVVWVREDGVWLVELFNDAIFAGELADGARCDVVPLDVSAATILAHSALTPAAVATIDPPPLVTPGPISLNEPGADIATAAVTWIFDCLSTLDPTRVYALATEDFRSQWASVATRLVPLAAPLPPRQPVSRSRCPRSTRCRFVRAWGSAATPT